MSRNLFCITMVHETYTIVQRSPNPKGLHTTPKIRLSNALCFLAKVLVKPPEYKPRHVQPYEPLVYKIDPPCGRLLPQRTDTRPCMVTGHAVAPHARQVYA